MRRLVVVGVTALLLAGCSAEADGGDEPETGDTAAENSSTAAPSPSASPTPEVTVEQWASAIAGVKGSVDDASAKWEENSCSALSAGEAPCSIYVVTMGATAETTALTVEGGLKPGVPAYIGTPPAEIEGLVQETLDAARAASAASSTAFDSCPGTECTATAFQFETAWGDLESVLDAWSPYGVM